MAKLIMKTEELQKVVGILSAINPNKLLEITKYWHIYGDEEGFMVTAYDGSNFVRYSTQTPIKDVIDVMVRADQFGKLVEKTTVEKISLITHSTHLEVVGNGNYKVDIVQEDEEYPSFDNMLSDDMEFYDIKQSVFTDVANRNESAVSKSGADGIFTGYLLTPEFAVTTDTIRICVNPNFKGTISDEILVPAQLMSIMSGLIENEIGVSILSGPEGKALYAETDHIQVYGTLLEGQEDYIDVTQITESIEFDGTVLLPSQNISSILGRLTLFMTPFDRGIITLDFKDNVVTIKTEKGSKEAVKFYKNGEVESDKIEPFTCRVNSVLLKDILATISEPYFEVNVGNEDLIKIKSKDVEYYLALAGEDEGEE